MTNPDVNEIGVPREGSPQTVWELLERRVELTPDQRFLRVGDGPWLTFRETMERAERIAAGLVEAGVVKGDRVASVMQNSVEAVLAPLACARTGAVNVPLNFFLRGPFLRHQLEDPQPKVIVADEPGYHRLAAVMDDLTGIEQVYVTGSVSDTKVGTARVSSFDELENCSAAVTFATVTPFDTFAILYTSGTTGAAKGCVESHSYATNVGRCFGDAGYIRPNDILLTPARMFHGSGLFVTMTTSLTVGASPCYEPQFHASTFLDRAREVGATAIFGPGGAGLLLMAQPPSPRDKDHQVTQAFLTAMRPEAEIAFEERFGIHVINEVFGHSEFVPVTMSPVSGPRRRGTAGRPLPHAEVQLFDDDDRPVGTGQVGEIVVRPRRPGVMMDGYWNNPAATLATRRTLWHHTGDLARWDEDGFLVFVDRKKDAIRRRGEFVVTSELETAISAHPGVKDVAVHAVRSDLTEDEVMAWIVPEAGAQLEPAGLFEFFKEHIPYYAIPRFVELIDELPVNHMARVQKHLLKERPTGENTWDLQALGFSVATSDRR